MSVNLNKYVKFLVGKTYEYDFTEGTGTNLAIVVLSRTPDKINCMVYDQFTNGEGNRKHLRYEGEYAVLGDSEYIDIEGFHISSAEPINQDESRVIALHSQ